MYEELNKPLDITYEGKSITEYVSKILDWNIKDYKL